MSSLREQLAGRGSMAFVAANVQLKAKLLTKGKLRPHDMVRKKLPDGAGLLEDLPRRARSGADEGDEAADAAYCAAIDKVSRVFGKQKRAQSTADEHKMYMRLLDGWFVREGFGSYVEAVIVDEETGRRSPRVENPVGVNTETWGRLEGCVFGAAVTRAQGALLPGESAAWRVCRVRSSAISSWHWRQA